jgi:hypothetical protein
MDRGSQGTAFFAYSDNYLIDVKPRRHRRRRGVQRAIRQAEVGVAKTMIERTEERFGLPTPTMARWQDLPSQAASYRRPQDMALTLINKVVNGPRELFHTRVA